MISILINIILPTIIMTRFSGEDQLGAIGALLVALAFPFLYAIYEMAKQKKVGWMPIVGLVSILITGGIGLLKLPAGWIAIKEAMIPAILAFAIIISAWIGKPLARVFLDQILNKERVHAELEKRGNLHEYERRTAVATWLLAGAFFLSAALNFILATIVVTADGGTQEYTQQMGRMTALSFPVITIPVFIVLTGTIFYIMNTVSKLTGLEAEDVLRDHKAEKRAQQEARDGSTAQ